MVCDNLLKARVQALSVLNKINNINRSIGGAYTANCYPLMYMYYVYSCLSIVKTTIFCQHPVCYQNCIQASRKAMRFLPNLFSWT